MICMTSCCSTSAMVALADAYGHSTLTFGNASPSSNILERNSLTLVTMC